VSFNPRLYLFGLASFVLTAYILLSAYAIIFVQPLPFINAIARAESTDLITSTAKSDGAIIAFSIPKGVNQNNENLQLLKIPKNNTRLNLTKGIVKDNSWFIKPDDGHYLFLINQKTNTLNDILIYTNRDWRTISNPDSILVGDNMFIQTDTSFQYLFRIIDKKTVSLKGNYIPDTSTTLGMILIIQDDTNKSASIIRGRLINSLGASQ
jgi:hypothetical protein